MSSGESKKPGKPIVVEIAKASRNWKGAYQAEYNCPRCRSPLVSLDDTLLGTETCPNCSTAFVFGQSVQAGYRTHKAAAEEKAAEKQRQAEDRKRVAEERARVAEAEQRRLDQEQRDYVVRAQAEAKAFEREKAKKISARRSSIGGVETGIGTLSVLSFIGGIIMVAVGVSALANDGSPAGMALFITGVVSLVSLLLVWGLFRCLFAIHQLLTDISAKLDGRQRDG